MSGILVVDDARRREQIQLLDLFGVFEGILGRDVSSKGMAAQNEVL